MKPGLKRWLHESKQKKEALKAPFFIIIIKVDSSLSGKMNHRCQGHFF